MFSVVRVRSTVHDLAHKTDLQPQSGRNQNHVTIAETVVPLEDQQHRLYSAVDPKRRIYAIQHRIDENERDHRSAFGELREKHDVDDTAFLIDGAIPL